MTCDRLSLKLLQPWMLPSASATLPLQMLWILAWSLMPMIIVIHLMHLADIANGLTVAMMIVASCERRPNVKKTACYV